MVELRSSSDLKKILYSLRKKGIIDENQFVQALDKLKEPSKTVQNQLVPLLDMFGLHYIDVELQQLDLSIKKIEKTIKETIQAWEAGALSKDETKDVLTELVLQKNTLIHHHEKLHHRIQTKVSRLRTLKKASNFDLEGFTSSLLQSADVEKITNLIIEFKDIWLKYVTEGAEDELKRVPGELDEVELEILQSLMVPIPEKERIIFNLNDIIQPVDQNENFQSSLLEDKNQKEKFSDEDHIDHVDAVQEQKTSSPWDLVGIVAYNPSKSPIGFFRSPIVVNKTVFLPVAREESLSKLLLKERYEEVLNQANLDLSITTTQQIRITIAKALKVPEGLALQPSFFNQWISDLGFEVTPTKPQLKKVWFVELDSIDSSSSDIPIIKNEELKKISIPAWIPARGENVSEPMHIGQRITGMAGSDFGVIVGIMNETPFGQSLVIERKIPPSSLLDLYLEGLGKENLAELRFIFAKELNIGEGEAFSADNLWLMNNQERLLISPHEITASYFSVLPAAAFTFSEKIRAKIGVYFHSVPETFRYLIGKPLTGTEEEMGLIYGFSVHQGEFYILWSSKPAVDIIKELGRKSSEQYVNRLQRRISLALGIPHEQSLWPNNLARYFMNFIWMEEQLTLKKALTTIEERFSLQKILFSEITEITKDGLKCEKNPG
ncbi:MAG: hypothetical protein JSU57_04310 [Candidatus Heimdallarchaeota archaeon]|nr:MAG: hypothetical protein JSU57_04310 [Candidatus Heimdallarchaeota archaeon]